MDSVVVVVVASLLVAASIVYLGFMLGSGFVIYLFVSLLV